MLAFRAEIDKMLVITGKTLIRLLLQKQSDLGLHCLSSPFWQAGTTQKQSILGLFCLFRPFWQAGMTQKQSDLGLFCLFRPFWQAGTTQKQSDLGLFCLFRSFCQATSVQNFRTFTIYYICLKQYKLISNMKILTYQGKIIWNIILFM